MSSSSKWRATSNGAAVILACLLCPAIGHANALFVDDFEAGDDGAWSEEPSASIAEDVISAEELPEEEPLRKFFPDAENGVPGRYIVTLFTVPAASAAAELVDSVDGTLGYVYQHALNGFDAELSESQAEQLSQHPWVRKVVQNSIVAEPASSILPHCYGTTFGHNDNPQLPPLPDSGNPIRQQSLDCSSATTDCSDNWGLDRLDSDTLTDLDSTFRYRQTGDQVTVYTIDTGIFPDNQEFDDAQGDSRVEAGISTTCATPGTCGAGNQPCNGTLDYSRGHGTHVAAILGGRTYGLARGVTFQPVKALCPNGYTSYFTHAFDWILSQHSPSNPDTAIVNLSGLNSLDPCEYLWNDGTCSHLVFEAALALASQENILLVQSAGNQPFTGGQGASACNDTFGDESQFSVQAERDAIARIVIAGGSDENDGLWRTSNGEFGYPNGSTVGSCIDVFAPASYVVSAYYPRYPDSEPETIICQLSGTSMAAPHVAGIAAMLLEEYRDLPDPAMNAGVLKAMLVSGAEHGDLQSNVNHYNYIGSGSPNLLVNWTPETILRANFETGKFLPWIVSP